MTRKQSATCASLRSVSGGQHGTVDGNLKSPGSLSPLASTGNDLWLRDKDKAAVAIRTGG